MPSDPIVLAFDTSAAHCAAALLSGGRALAKRQEEMAKGQAERLMPLLQEVLVEAGAGWRDITCIGVGIGPGNFTGVRISVSAARGLALGLGCPAIGVNTLAAMAHGTAGPVLATLDARRGMVYAAGFGAAAFAPRLAAPQEIDVGHTGPTCIGHLAEDFAARFGGRATSAANPIAVAIAEIASRTPAGAEERPAPLYLRGADAAPPREAPPVILP